MYVKFKYNSIAIQFSRNPLFYTKYIRKTIYSKELSGIMIFFFTQKRAAKPFENKYWV